MYAAAGAMSFEEEGNRRPTWSVRTLVNER